MENIVIYIPAATTFAKTAVDVFKMAYPKAPSWLFPLLAVLVGVGSILLLFMATGVLITQQSAAVAILGGFLGGAGAVGVTSLHNAGQDARDDAQIAEAISRATPAEARAIASAVDKTEEAKAP